MARTRKAPSPVLTPLSWPDRSSIYDRLARAMRPLIRAESIKAHRTSVPVSPAYGIACAWAAWKEEHGQ